MEKLIEQVRQNRIGAQMEKMIIVKQPESETNAEYSNFNLLNKQRINIKQPYLVRISPKDSSFIY